MSGFPGWDPDQANKVQTYDVEAARKLMAERLSRGKGFPVLELWLRNENQLLPWEQPTAAYLQAHLKDALGVNVVPRTIEVKTFTDALNSHSQQPLPARVPVRLCRSEQFHGSLHHGRAACVVEPGL